MKKFILFAAIVVAAFACFGCAKNQDYSEQVSQLRTEILFGESDGFAVTAIPETRETPFTADGKAGKMQSVLIIRVVPKEETAEQIKVNFTLDKSYSETLVASGVREGVVATVVTSTTAASGLVVTVTCGDKQENVTLYSQKNEKTVDWEKAVAAVERAQKDLFDSVKRNEKELHIRLLSEKGQNFWYIGVLDADETRAFLVAADGSRIIAEKVIKTNE